MYKQDFI